MINITLPDGSIKQFSENLSGLQLAESIGPGLARAALAIKIDDQVLDISTMLSADLSVAIITAKSDEGLEIIRHDSAHIMAQAVKELYPETQVTIGPAIENGFYYDFYRETQFTLQDLELIEQKMKEIVARNQPIIREIWKRDEAIKFFDQLGEKYKVEIIKDIPSDQDISLYRQGDFIDLCRGPHAASTGSPKAFKLTKLAGAYWRGNSNNVMLQRIYGTAWADEKQLKAHLLQQEEAAKRDHRKLAKELDLFHLQEEAMGMVFWHAKGWSIFLGLENYIRNKLKQHEYMEVKTPILLDKSLWEASGHWEKFRDDMFTSEFDEHVSAVKPMSCPCHVQIFNQGIKSYRDLPLRMSEFGCCHRNESSGALHGLMRVRAMTQDDGHIFCTEEQINTETVAFCKLLQEIYADFGFTDVKVKFSDRPVKRAGSDEVWDKAEKALREAVIEAGIEYTMNPGEGAFYGPKLEFVLRDAIGRDWQCGTFQVDFVLPERLGASYIASDGKKHHPVMLHRAIFGSLERFIGILIEHYEGKFPLWLAPEQVVITTITEESDIYALHIKNELDKIDIRSKLDISNEKINNKIRIHSLQKIPIIVTIGKKEVQDGTVSIRTLGKEQQEIKSLDSFIESLKNITINKI